MYNNKHKTYKYKVEFQRLFTRSKNRAQAISQPGDDYDRLRYRNWLSLINFESGAWLSAGPSPKMFEMSNTEFISAVCRRAKHRKRQGQSIRAAIARSFL